MNNFFKVLFLAALSVLMCGKMMSEAKVFYEEPEIKTAFEAKLEKDAPFRKFLKDRLFNLMAKYEDNPNEPRWNAEHNNCKWSDAECLSGKGKKSTDRDRKKNNMLTR